MRTAGLECAGALVALLFGSVASTADAPAPKLIAYSGATIIDGDPTTVRRNMVIATRGERIVAVQPVEEFPATSADEMIDVRGKIVIPGLINTHVHLATSADPPQAKAYLRRELQSGVTTVRDMAGDVRLLAELQREAEFDELESPDIVFAALVAGPGFFADPRTHQSARGRSAGEVPWMRAVTPDTDLRVAIAQARGTGATAIKIYADLPASLVRAVVAEAHRQDMQVWAHAAIFPALPSEVIDAGVDVISHSCLLGYEVLRPPAVSYEHRAPVGSVASLESDRRIDELLARIKRRGTILDATVWTFDSHPSPKCPAGVEDYLTRRAYAAGIPISTGTDDEPGSPGTDSAIYSELALLVERVGMTPADAIRSATIIGARAVGLEGSIGTIERGKLANFVVLDRNPLERIENVASVSFVVKHGMRHPHGSLVPADARASTRPGDWQRADAATGDPSTPTCQPRILAPVGSYRGAATTCAGYILPLISTSSPVRSEAHSGGT